MNIFYKPDIKSNQITLDPGESMHCIKVMRYKKGDCVRLIDGRGGYYKADIINDNPRACEISIVSYQEEFEPLSYRLDIAIAPTKNIDRFEWFLEKATEIGISSVTPIICQRSERKNIRIDRLEKVIIAAMKQSVKAYLPKLNSLTYINDWIKDKNVGSRFIAHCMEAPKKDLWKADLSESITILIGPEGDFTQEELQMALSYDFLPVSLGNYRLRTETAGVVACTAVSIKKQ